MLTPIHEIFSATGVLPSFTCYNFEQVAGVLSASELSGTPVCILISEKAFTGRYGPRFTKMTIALAQTASVPIAVQLDHTGDLHLIEAALDFGVSAIMADGSHLPFEDNADLVRRACKIARQYGASVEAELGHIPGNEDIAHSHLSQEMTDVDSAVRFATETGADLLAVAIGNVHGRYKSQPTLNIDLLSALTERVSVPLSLHGTSGIPNDQILCALQHGIRKFNINTQLREIYFASAQQQFANTNDTVNLLVAVDRLADATERFVTLLLAAIH
ncbi:class II fructose-bisphosphate aldolase [Mycolicibacterium sp. 624]|uniref:class II fructose-bisphosphate aldolase n=1 Tax=Mycolicibacterium sp. 624 TaxID=3156314 RepID=UPI00339658E4